MNYDLLFVVTCYKKIKTKWGVLPLSQVKKTILDDNEPF